MAHNFRRRPDLQGRDTLHQAPVMHLAWLSCCDGNQTRVSHGFVAWLRFYQEPIYVPTRANFATPIDMSCYRTHPLTVSVPKCFLRHPETWKRYACTYVRPSSPFWLELVNIALVLVVPPTSARSNDALHRHVFYQMTRQTQARTCTNSHAPATANRVGWQPLLPTRQHFWTMGGPGPGTHPHCPRACMHTIMYTRWTVTVHTPFWSTLHHTTLLCTPVHAPVHKCLRHACRDACGNSA